MASQPQLTETLSNVALTFTNQVIDAYPNDIRLDKKASDNEDAELRRVKLPLRNSYVPQSQQTYAPTVASRRCELNMP